MYSDNLFSFDLPSLIAFHKAKAGAATIAVYEKEGDLKGSGVVSIDKDLRVLEFIEKPENPRGTLVNAGLYVLEPKAICQVPCNSFFDFGKDLFPKMLREGVPIFASRVIGSIVPIDTPELLESANAF
jgi:NDP-sugar pyrophosphorylase family protein